MVMKRRICDSLDVRDSGDGDVIDVSIASATPVARAYGDEVLVMDGADLSRGANMPVLVDHRNAVESICGTIERLYVDGDKLRAKIAWADSDCGRMVREGVEGGWVGNMSIGYDPREIETDPKSKTDRVTSWTLHEASFVAVPADSTVGVGRQQEAPTMPDTPTTNGALEGTATDAGTLLEYGRKLGQVELASRVIAEGGTLDGLRREIVAANAARARESATDVSPPTERRSATPWLRPAPAIIRREHYGDDYGSFSLCRLLLSLDPRSSEHGCPERERCISPETRGGRRHGAVGLPADALAQLRFWPGGRVAAHRALTAGTTGSGAELVPVEHLGQDFVDIMRPNSLAMAGGVTVIPVERGDVEIPTKTAGTSLSWLSSETGALTVSDPTLAEISAEPHEGGVATAYSHKLLLQSSPDVEMMVREDLAGAVSDGIDAAIVHGSGSAGQPKGLLAFSETDGVADVVAGTNGTDLSWSAVVNLRVATAGKNARPGAFAASSKVLGKLAQTARATSVKYNNATADNEGGAYVLGNDWASMAGRPVIESNSIKSGVTKGTATSSTGALIYGDWTDAILFRWSGLDVLVDPYTARLSRKITVSAYIDVDVGFRHLGSFAFISDAKHG